MGAWLSTSSAVFHSSLYLNFQIFWKNTISMLFATVHLIWQSEVRFEVEGVSVGGKHSQVLHSSQFHEYNCQKFSRT